MSSTFPFPLMSEHISEIICESNIQAFKNCYEVVAGRTEQQFQFHVPLSLHFVVMGKFLLLPFRSKVT